jgi:hypothetical protein
MKLFSLLAIASYMIMFMLNCSPDVAGTGTGEETTNGRVIGKVVDAIGNPVKGAVVTLVPADYDPVKDTVTIPIVKTDSNGLYDFNRIDSGVYNVYSASGGHALCAMSTDVGVASDTVEAALLKLLPPGSIKVFLPSGTDAVNGYVYIKGTDVFRYINGQTDWLVFDTVPSGVIPEIAYANIKNNAKVVIRRDVKVETAGMVDVHNPSWVYARKIVINTAASGAGTTGTITHFPVLVRLTDGDFPFSQAEPSGLDIRFVRVDSLFLPYEIERWDAANKQAEIWVMVDTIFGNDSLQSVMMYWGNPIASDASNAKAVFDTTDGFVGVWHMNENPSNGGKCILDRTANAYHATVNGKMSRDASVEGVTGKALRFDGIDDYLNAGAVNITSAYTIGLWVTLDTLNNYQRFLYKDSCYTLWYDRDSVSVRMEHMSTTPVWWRGLLQNGGSHVTMISKVWYYFAATYDGAVVRIYKNGVEVSKSDPINVFPASRLTSLLFGQSRNDSYVGGIMDEIRIEKKARSAEWIKLSFSNQKMNSKIVSFNK